MNLARGAVSHAEAVELKQAEMIQLTPDDWIPIFIFQFSFHPIFISITAAKEGLLFPSAELCSVSLWSHTKYIYIYIFYNFLHCR